MTSEIYAKAAGPIALGGDLRVSSASEGVLARCESLGIAFLLEEEQELAAA
ncbi:hypothetical protein [Candidatus Nephthysia bennettiae]|uniref:Uncharacterized protein n=1 Tax=Candidatus Nephthysia bennettiae TaxID=3127016 RepID=A0A934NB00_9BACT|nr:hypothetical protein [Candidatus Dormibacteraeota bacterium]MBJ7613796.1 hypothetical protein [Candidatus Dormibacteraeota bacterium]